jgi:predicted CoA-binding protein
MVIREILESATTIATVGASRDPWKAAGGVPRSLRQMGFRVIPVNPNVDEIDGEKTYPSLLELPEPVDVVQVFRPSDEAPGIARQAVEIGAKALWLQLGIVSEDARRIAEEAGLAYVEDHCMPVEARRLRITKTPAA